MLIAQISDCHIVEPGGLFADRVDSAAGLRAAVATINALEVQPDLVVATGDLVNEGSAEQYDRLEACLADLRAPVVPLPGNHDNRGELRRRWADRLPPGTADDPIDFTVEGHAVRIVALDTTIPGRHDGLLTDAQLDWLDTQLHAAPEHPTIIAQHHPPVSSGVLAMDRTCGFGSGDREAEVVGRHPQVEAVVSGHLHRSFQRRFAGTISITCPSTAGQLGLELKAPMPRYTSEPTGLLLHHWRAGAGLTSHVVPVGVFDVWTPSWVS